MTNKLWQNISVGAVNILAAVTWILLTVVSAVNREPWYLVTLYGIGAICFLYLGIYHIGLTIWQYRCIRKIKKQCERYDEQNRNCKLHSPFNSNCRCNGNEKKCMYVRGENEQDNRG